MDSRRHVVLRNLLKMPAGVYVRTEEHKKKLSLANIGKHPWSEEKRKKMSLIKMGQTAWNKGLTKETDKRLMKTAKKVKGNTNWLGKHHSIKTRRKMSIAKRGKNNNLWKGGITSINRLIRVSFKYRLWRELVFERDDWTCQDCGKRGGKLNAHHIKPFSLFPDLRFVINNGITLCRKCHKKMR